LTSVIKRYEGKKKEKSTVKEKIEIEKRKKRGKVTSEIRNACPACNWAFRISKVTEEKFTWVRDPKLHRKKIDLCFSH